MKVHELSEADIVAVSIVGKGANRKTFFMRKAEDDEELVALSGTARIVKASDWSAVYCVVAEPGWIEEPGKGADQSVPDIWASPDEIRKAAHRFMRNGPLVTKMHESLAPFGAVVENFIAPDDLQVEGEIIKEGSWVVAIEPNADGKAAIEKGEFTGVSIEGTALRTLVEKTHAGERRGGPIENLIRHYLKKPHPFTSCVRDNRKRFGPRAEAVCAGLKDLALGTHRWRAQFKKASDADDAGAVDKFVAARAKAWTDAGLSAEDATACVDAYWPKVKKGGRANLRDVGLLERIAKKVGVTDDELAEIEKAEPMNFAERMAQRDLDEELPQAMDILRGVIWRAFNPLEDDAADPKTTIAESLDQFKEWALGMIDRVGVEKVAESLAELPDPDELADLYADIAKRDVKTDERKRLAGEGKALPDGSFPIASVADLRNAISAFGRAGDKAAAKRHITKRARALRRTDLLPDSWKVTKSDTKNDESATVEDEMTLTEDERAELDGLKKSVEDLPEKIAEAIAKASEEAKPPTADELATTLAEVQKSVGEKFDAIAKGIEALGEGGSAQTSTEDPEAERKRVEKSEDQRYAEALLG